MATFFLIVLPGPGRRTGEAAVDKSLERAKVAKKWGAPHGACVGVQGKAGEEPGSSNAREGMAE